MQACPNAAQWVMVHSDAPDDDSSRAQCLASEAWFFQCLRRLRVKTNRLRARRQNSCLNYELPLCCTGAWATTVS